MYFIFFEELKCSFSFTPCSTKDRAVPLNITRYTFNRYGFCLQMSGHFTLYYTWIKHIQYCLPENKHFKYSETMLLILSTSFSPWDEMFISLKRYITKNTDILWEHPNKRLLVSSDFKISAIQWPCFHAHHFVIEVHILVKQKVIQKKKKKKVYV